MIKPSVEQSCNTHACEEGPYCRFAYNVVVPYGYHLNAESLSSNNDTFCLSNTITWNSSTIMLRNYDICSKTKIELVFKFNESGGGYYRKYMHNNKLYDSPFQVITENFNIFPIRNIGGYMYKPHNKFCYTYFGAGDDFWIAYISRIPI